MSAVPAPAPSPRVASDRGLWLAYGGLCLLCWALYVMGSTEWQRGAWNLWKGLYYATWNMGPPAVLGMAALPWMRWLRRHDPWSVWQRLGAHAMAALVFAAAWQGTEYVVATLVFSQDHANAMLQRQVAWQGMWSVFVYIALVMGFGGALHARRASEVAVSAARAEAALVRAELAAINGKLNPHFLFNTLNSLLMLTRRDPAAAEQTLLRFSRMMRYVLDTTRGSSDRVTLQEEIDFVRDYLELEALRLGPRLKVDWQIDPATVNDPIPPLTLQPLVENSVLHGIAPQLQGGTVQIRARRVAHPNPDGEALALRVCDDGAGCTWPPAQPPDARAAAQSGVGLSALRRRFELDFGGRAEMSVRSAPGAGFQVDILIPQAALFA